MVQITATLQQFSFPVAVAVFDAAGIQGGWGESETQFPWASVTKLATSALILDQVGRGQASLKDAVGPAGATLADLLGHTAGYAFDDASIIAPPRAKRIYSNHGIEVAARHVFGSDDAFAKALTERLLGPAGIDATLKGPASHGLHGSIRALAALGIELLEPQVLDAKMVRLGKQPYLPGLAGVLPGYGQQQDNCWGLGFEIRANKSPHWTAPSANAQTCGHFGAAGSFLWIDPTANLGAAFLGAQPFGPQHQEFWPQLNEAILAAYLPG